MFTAGQKVKVSGTNWDMGTGVVLAASETVLDAQSDEIQILLDTSTADDKNIFSVFAGQEHFLTAV